MRPEPVEGPSTSPGRRVSSGDPLGGQHHRAARGPGEDQRGRMRTVRPQLAAELATLFGRDLADQPAIVMTQLRAAARFDISARLPELAGIRTLVMSARHDRIAPPRFGRALAAGIPGARYVEIETAGHAAPIQCAGEVNALLADHLGRR